MPNNTTRYIPVPREGIHAAAVEQQRAIRTATCWGDLLRAARAQWEWAVGSPERSVLSAEATTAKDRLMRGVHRGETGFDMPITPGTFLLSKVWY